MCLFFSSNGVCRRKESFFVRKRYIGFFCILTSGIKNPMDALSVYRAKEAVENSFDDLKNHLDMKRLRIHTSAAKEDILQTFNLSENGHIASCPKGHIPEKTRKRKNRYGAAFNSQTCQSCPIQDNCPSNQRKKFHYINYTDKGLRISKRRAYEQTHEFKDKYRYRSGVEATMSEYDRRTGVKRLRVRGLKAVRYCATMKAAAVARTARNRADRGKWHTYFAPNRIFRIVKELFWFFKPNSCYESLMTAK